MKFDKPWEGAFSAYCTIIKTPEKFQLFYRGSSTTQNNCPAEVTCYAESKDGIHWTKPNLGLYEVHGTKDNNVILANAVCVNHNFCPFLDTNPQVPADQCYKALGGSSKSGLIAYVSADGIHWKKLQDEPVFNRKGWVFDSQNVSFWSPNKNQYELYYREVPNGIRTVARTTSKDFLNWTEPVMMSYSNTGSTIPRNHIYISQTHPYFRAPHIYIATAARFMPGRGVLTSNEAKAINVHPKYFGDISDSVFMTSRGSNQYDCTFENALIKPGIGYENWVSRTNYPVLNVVQTSEHEMSLYVQHNSCQPTAHLRRYTLRLDGFSSIEAPFEGGEMISKPFVLMNPQAGQGANSVIRGHQDSGVLPTMENPSENILEDVPIYDGKQNVQQQMNTTYLMLNFATSAAGGIFVEIQNADGKPIPGFTLKDSRELIGNSIERAVSWNSNRDLAELIGKTIRLRFVMKDANLYAIRFR